MSSVPGPSSTEAVLEHAAAFNAHDRVRLLAGLAPDATWLTGRHALHGHAELAEMFDDGLWALNPSLRVLRLVAEAEQVAAEMAETLTVDGGQQVFPIACFFDLQGATIRRVKVFARVALTSPELRGERPGRHEADGSPTTGRPFLNGCGSERLVRVTGFGVGATAALRSGRAVRLVRAVAGDTDYESSGQGYEQRRRPDPQIAAQVHRKFGDARSVLNVGAGAGSYEPGVPE